MMERIDVNYTWVIDDDCDYVFFVFENFLIKYFFEEEYKNRRFR